MQRKPGFPVANCSIKMPEGPMMPEAVPTAHEDDVEQRRLQLINFGHSQWGFNNWSWSVTKQDVDFIDFANGKYCVGVAAFVNITVKSFDIHRENVGYATSVANTKGFAVYKSRKCAVTNALRETLLSFGGSVATELTELLESHRVEFSAPANQPEHASENNQNVANRVGEPKNSAHNRPPRKDSVEIPGVLRSPHGAPPAVKNAPLPASAAPLPLGPPPQPPPPPANRQPLPPGRPVPARPNSNVSFVLQPVVGSVVPPLYGAGPRLGAPPLSHVLPPAYYEYPGPWHFAYESYERPPGNVNLNFNMPPKNLVVNGRGGVECRNACRPPDDLPPPAQPCWIKPTIFYDGFWTEQKVKKWVAEQVEKQFPEDSSRPAASPAAHVPPQDNKV